MNSMVRTIFDPELCSKTKKVYEDGIAFVQECIEQGHKVFILSNMDKDTFAQFQKMLPGFFEQFDGIVISAEVGLIKPDPAIFAYLLNTYNLDPEETVFIDDQKENLTAAAQIGIYPIECKMKGLFKKRPNFKAVRKDFEQWQVLSEWGII